MTREWIETSLCSYGYCSFGLCWVDLRIVEEGDKRGISGAICFMGAPHRDGKILDGRDVHPDVSIFDRMVFDKSLFLPGKLTAKLVGVELQEEASGPVSLDGEHYVVGFTFKARALFNYGLIAAPETAKNPSMKELQKCLHFEGNDCTRFLLSPMEDCYHLAAENKCAHPKGPELVELPPSGLVVDKEG